MPLKERKRRAPQRYQSELLRYPVKTQGRGLGNFHWQSGYSAFSVSAADVDEVTAYIEQQENHHRVVSLYEEFRKLMAAHGIAWDERYVWD